MKRSILAVAAAWALAVAGGAAKAAVIYDNGGPNPAGGNQATAWVQAEDVTLGAGGTIGGAGVYIGGFEDGINAWDGTVEYFLFADDAGSPGVVLASGAGRNAATTDTGLSWTFSGNVFLLEFDFAEAFAAAAGTTYWFGIHLSEDFDGESIFWVWADPNGTSRGQESHEGSFDNWAERPPFDSSVEHAFFLTEAEEVSVPEPSILALLGAGLAGLGLIRSRRAA